LEELLHGLGGLGPLAQPLDGLGIVDEDGRGVLAGLVRAEDLDEPAVAGRAAVGRHHPVGRLLLLAHPHEAELHCHAVSTFIARSGPSWPFAHICSPTGQAGSAAPALTVVTCSQAAIHGRTISRL